MVGTVLLNGRQTTQEQDGPVDWRDRQDYGENVTGDLLGNAIASGVPAAEILRALRDPAGPGARGRALTSWTPSAAWAATVFPSRGLRGAVRETLLQLTRESTPYGIPPIEGWTPGRGLDRADGLVGLGARSSWARPVPRIGCCAELHRAATPHGTLPERVDASTGAPTSTTPLAWSHAFAILALRARYPG